MFFSGRSFDTFESAIAMLIGEDFSCNYMDCLSGRAFTLSRKNDDALFSCESSVEEAVENLNVSMGDVLSTVSPYDLHEPFVIELRQDIGIPTIFRKYYPHGHFIFCLRKGDEVHINDPDGFPCLSYSIEELQFGDQKAIVSTGIKPLIQFDMDYIRQSGVKRLRSARVYDIITANYSRMFMQYAIRNYVCQTNKVLVFLCEYTSVAQKSQDKIESLFSQMLLQTKYPYDEIARLDEQIFLLLEGLLCL